LKISFDALQTYVKTDIEGKNQQGCFCHLLIHNDGAEVAHDCEVWLMTVSAITHAGENEEKRFYAARQLHWAYNSR
jgi:hypothetical protein